MSPEAFEVNISSIVLLSGGLDSVVNLFEAQCAGQVLKALTFDYGQRASKKEIAAATFFCSQLKIEHQILDLSWLSRLTTTALVNENEKLPFLKNLDDIIEGNQSAKAVWVPNRNGVFLNIAASFAESLGAQFVVPGFNKEEASTFPDNSQGYIDALNLSFGLSTLSQVKVKCFTTGLGKREIVTRAKVLNIDLDMVWSCYRGGVKKCGECESCQRTLRALNAV
jgi:7-cyano-7-deazaguanine synthase